MLTPYLTLWANDRLGSTADVPLKFPSPMYEGPDFRENNLKRYFLTQDMQTGDLKQELTLSEFQRL